MLDIPETLAKALRDRKVIPFVGAGVSRAVLDKEHPGKPLFPSWLELLEAAETRLRGDNKTAEAMLVHGCLHKRKPDYLRAAEDAREGLGAVWYQLLREICDPPFARVEPSSLALARSIWKLPSRLIITTNYDRVLQWACEQPNDVITLKNEATAELAELQRNLDHIDRPTVWHLHGQIHDAERLILTPDGYSALYPEGAQDEQHYRAALTTLRNLLTARTFLFIGFSLDDEKFGDQITWVDETFADATGPHYLLVKESNVHDAQQRIKRFRNIACLPFSAYGQPLIDRIATLTTAATVRSVAKVTTPTPIARQDHARADEPLPERSEALHKWLEFGVERHGKLRVLGFRERHQIRLELDRVFVPLVMNTAQRRRGGVADRAHDKDQERALEHGEHAVSLDEALALVDTTDAAVGLVLLGHAGAGKTTLLKHLYCRAAEHGFTGPLDHLRAHVPVLLRLSNVHDDEQREGGLRVAVARQAREQGYPEAGAFVEATKNQRFLFLLDGLDEVRDEATRLALCEWLNQEVDHWRGSRFVVTSRFAAWQRTPQLNNQFLKVQLRGLDPPSVELFVRRWFHAVEMAFRGNDTPAAAEVRGGERAQALLDALAQPGRRSIVRLREMTDNPLLLSTLCLVHHSDHRLPDKRSELYDRSIGLLLETWAKERKSDVPSDAARLVLQPLAYAMHERDVREIDAADAEALVKEPLAEVTALRHFTAEKFLQHVADECSVLASRDFGRYEFFHLSFQEYLAAAHIAERGLAGALAERAGDPRWEEVILLGMTFPGVFRAFMEPMLVRGDPRDHAALIRQCMAETYKIDHGPFVSAIDRARAGLPAMASSLAVLLELLRGYEPPAVLERVRGLVNDPDPALRAAVRAMVGMPDVAGVAAAAMPTTGQPWTEPSTGMPFVWVPPGRFLMGSSKREGAPGYERPAHWVTLTAGYWMGRHPVTNREYEVFVREANAPAPAYWGDRRFNDPAQPVVGVAWDDAWRFAEWLTRKNAGELRFALPTEAEWEYAARGTDGRCYPWGNELPTRERAHFAQSLDTGRPLPIGQLPAGRSPFGVEEMAGNVWEWCRDAWRDDYQSDQPVDDPCHDVDTAGAARVVRGGSWNLGPRLLRAAIRDGLHPGGRDGYLGFRVVCRGARQHVVP